MAGNAAKAKPAETPQQTEGLTPADLLTLYWNYYALHAGQRMKILEIYVGFMTPLLGAYAATFRTHPRIAMAAAFAVAGISFICFHLDTRIQNLMHICRIALRKLEDQQLGIAQSELKLFSEIKRMESEDRKGKNKKSKYTPHVKGSFHTILRICYVITSFGGLGVFAIHLCLILWG